jgi:hypothetical protein
MPAQMRARMSATSSAAGCGAGAWVCAQSREVGKPSGGHRLAPGQCCQHGCMQPTGQEQDLELSVLFLRNRKAAGKRQTYLGFLVGCSGCRPAAGGGQAVARGRGRRRREHVALLRQHARVPAVLVVQRRPAAKTQNILLKAPGRLWGVESRRSLTKLHTESLGRNQQRTRSSCVSPGCQRRQRRPPPGSCRCCPHAIGRCCSSEGFCVKCRAPFARARALKLAKQYGSYALYAGMWLAGLAPPCMPALEGGTASHM